MQNLYGKDIVYSRVYISSEECNTHTFASAHGPDEIIIDRDVPAATCINVADPDDKDRDDLTIALGDLRVYLRVLAEKRTVTA